MHEPKVVALLAGLALEILFAPEAGAGTRDKLSESLSHLGDSIKHPPQTRPISLQM